MRRKVSERRLRRIRRAFCAASGAGMGDKHFTLRVNDGQPFFIYGAGTPPRPPIIEEKTARGGQCHAPCCKLLDNNSHRLRGVNGCQSFFFKSSIKQRCAAYKQSVILLHLAPRPPFRPARALEELHPRPGTSRPSTRRRRPARRQNRTKKARRGGELREILPTFC